MDDPNFGDPNHDLTGPKGREGNDTGRGFECVSSQENSDSEWELLSLERSYRQSY